MDKSNKAQIVKLDKAINIQYNKANKHNSSNFYKASNRYTYKYHLNAMKYMILSKLKLGRV